MPGFLDKVTKGLNDLAQSVNQTVSNSPTPGSGTSVTPPPPPGSAGVTPPPPPGSATGAPPQPSATSAPATGTVAGTQPPGVSDPDAFVDGTDPSTWVTPERMGQVVTYHVGREVSFGAPASFERPDAAVARYSSTDSSYTVDLVSFTEDTLGALGNHERFFAEYLRDVADHVEEPLFDRAVSGSSGEGHACCVDSCGDLGLRVDLYGPAEPGLDAHRAVVTRLVRDVLHEA